MNSTTAAGGREGGPMGDHDEQIGFIQTPNHNPPDIITRARDIVYLDDFGVNFNGSIDNFSAIISALEYARENKLFIKLPHGCGYLRVFEDSF